MSFENKYLHLFANCIPVKGSRRSAIYDLQNLEYFLIPNELYVIIESYKQLPVQQIREKYEKKNWNILDEYFQFLIDNELAVLVEKEDIALFPMLSMEWDYPGTISNAILDIGTWTYDYLKKVIFELDQIGCFNLQVRCFDEKASEYWSNFFKLFDNTRITSLECIIKYHTSISDINFWEDHVNKYVRIKNIQIHSTPTLPDNNPFVGRVFFYSYKVLDESNCGTICPQYFDINIQIFTESLKFNTCLNRKIAVDKSGLIKNCPSMQNDFGHVSNVSISDVIKKNEFQALWKLKKDDVLVCKDCEFRYMCTDCRAYLSNPQDIYSKPLKCGYNPYTAEWNEWQKQEFVLKAKRHYNLSEIK